VLYFVYIMTNPRNTVLYTGVTNNLVRRVYEHRNKLLPGFTKKYNAVKLVWFEETPDVRVAIEREIRIKGGSRQKKIKLVERINPEWKDLWEEISVM